MKTKITVVVHFAGKTFEASTEVPFLITDDEAQQFGNIFRDQLIERITSPEQYDGK